MMIARRRGLAALAAALALLALSGPAAAGACPEAGFAEFKPTAWAQARPVKLGRHKTVFVQSPAITTTADITDIRLKGDEEDTLLLLKLKPEAAQRLHDATTNRSGMGLAFVADDRVVSAVTWTGPYGMDADLGIQLSMPHALARLRPVVEAIGKCVGAQAPGAK
jgi:hypothetical protein